MTLPLTLADIAPAYPELLLAAGALVLVLIGAFRGDRAAFLVNALAILLLVAAMVLVLLVPNEERVTFAGSFVVDQYARYLKVLTLFGAAIALSMCFEYLKVERLDRFEFSILIVLSTLGMMMMISANDLIALYIGLELQSLALYVIAAIQRDNIKSTEAGLKYFALGALSSGMLLYGASLIYGFTGSVAFAAIAGQVATTPSTGLIFGLVFLLAGLAFKISAVPFHMWTPDVYEGAPTPVTSFFAAAPKVAAMAILVRVVIEAFPGITHQWQQIIVFISLGSMVLGAFAAIGQTNIKRLMAYSSIGHMGYALVGLAAGTANGVRGVLLYMAVYVVMSLGTFALILGMRRDGQLVENIDDLSGLSRTSPWRAFALASLLFSLAGIPPLGGFFAKYFVFAAAIETGIFALYVLAVLGVLASVVGAFYYLRIVKMMYFDEAKPAFQPMASELRIVLAGSAVFVIAFAVIAGPLIRAAEAAAKSLF